LVTASLAVAAHASRWPADGTALGSFFDPIFEQVMGRDEVPGAVCVVVDGEGIVFAKGYGVADLVSNTPVDPARTLFRLASISKVVTATCVMQLHERGRLDLHADVNDYLAEFRLPEAYAEPVTLAHLMTHTGGFDDRFLGMAAPTRERALPLGAYLARRMPPRVMPPGKTASYSNHGMALAGHVAEAVSGMPFEEYARKHVFEPLGMAHSAFRLTADLAHDLATGYDNRRGPLEPARYDFPHTVPASTLMMTGTDMARFMIAHLRLGEYGGARILKTATAEAMQRQQFTHHPGLPGRTYGFVESSENGLRIIRHDGLIWGFRSRMMLVPEMQLGVFVSCSGQSSGLTKAVTARFLDQFFPYKTERAQATVLPGFDERLRGITGFYRHNRHVRSTFVKFGTVAPEFVPEVRVISGPQPGMITLHWMAPRGRRSHYAEAEPGLFRRATRRSTDEPGVWRLAGSGGLAFGRDESGRATHLFMDTSAYERLRWYESRPALLGCAVAALAVLLVSLMGWLVAGAVGRLRRRRLETGAPALARRLAAFVCGLDVAFAAGLGLIIATADPYAFGYGPPPALVALLVLPVCSAALAVPLAALALLAWWKRYWGMWGRIHFTVTAVAAVVFLVLLDYWNLVGFRFG